MSSSLASASSSFSSYLVSLNFNSSKPSSPRCLRFASPILQTSPSVSRITVRACSPDGSTHDGGSCFIALKSFAGAAILFAASAAMIGRSFQLPARAESSVAVTEQSQVLEEGKGSDGEKQRDETSSPLSEFLETNAEAVDALKSLLQQKLENGDDEEALKILKRLVSAQPEETEWKFLMARLLSEMRDHENARDLYEQVLAVNPLSFEALFENALLMDRCGEGEAVIKRLEEALRIAEDKNKANEARDVRLIMAQIQFLQKNVEEAMNMYQQLTKEDPNDFRPYFCRGMIYSLLDKNEEAREQFAKYRELSPKKFEVEGYLRSPLSRLKLFGTDEN